MITRMITEETVGSSPSSNEGLNRTEKAVGARNGFNVNHMRSPTEEKLRLGVPRVQGGLVRVDLVHKEIVVKTKHIQRRVQGMPALEEVTVRR